MEAMAARTAATELSMVVPLPVPAAASWPVVVTSSYTHQTPLVTTDLRLVFGKRTEPCIASASPCSPAAVGLIVPARVATIVCALAEM
jgi:hypothetical protein